MAEVWLNGAVLPSEAARLDPADRGFLLGDGAFETLRFEAGVLRRWPRHRARLTAALQALEFDGVDLDPVPDAAARLAAGQSLKTAIIRLTVSRGPLGPGMTPGAGTATCLMTAAPRPQPPSAVRLVTLDAPRRDARNPSCRFKLIGYGDLLIARRQARAHGADMAVLLSTTGAVACADSASLIWIEGDRLLTPSLATGAMPGVTRAALMDAARSSGVGLDEVEAAPERVAAADAALVINAATGVVPVAAFDGRALDVRHAGIGRVQALEVEAS